MSVKVNLLPGEVAQKNRESRQRAAMGAAALGVVGLLGAVYVFQLNRIGDAEATLVAEEQRVTDLQAEVDELDEFGQLQARREAADELLRSSFADEISFAGLLQDLATVYPTGAELESVAIALADDSEAQLGATRIPIGRMNATGATLRGHAPGLERLLLELDKVAGFSNVFFGNSTQSEGGIAAFTLDVDLGEELLTDRYRDGIPEDMR